MPALLLTLVSRAAVALLALVLIACGSVAEPEPTAVRASVQNENVRAGYSVPVHLVNTTAFSWRVAPCPQQLQRLGAGGWRSVPLPPCSDTIVALDGGEPHVAALTVPFGSEFGTYRAVYGSWPDVPAASFAPIEQVTVYSNRFYVPAFR